jgi:DNA-binding transcriptional regulator YiaG
MTPKQLKAIRTKLDLTQLELGRRLELGGPRPDRVIRRWEAGTTKISGPAAVALRYMSRELKSSSAKI